jgi:hypothetical protein
MTEGEMLSRVDGRCSRCGSPCSVTPAMAKKSVWICRKCVNERNRAWQAAHQNYHRERCRTWRAEHREYLKEYRQRPDIAAKDRPRVRHTTPEKRRARSAVLNELRGGRISPQPCEVCGVAKTEAHHDDYSRPLDIRWLCSSHHKRHHAEHPCL